MIALNPLLDTIRSARHDFPTEMAKHLDELVYLSLAYASGYVYRLGKNWYQHGNNPDRQMALCMEAERLVKLRATLAIATDPLPKMTSAQAVIGDQLNQVLEKLSHALTEPEASTTHSRSMEAIGKYLLLYKSKGIVSVLMHWVFYFLVLVWGLFVSIGFTTTPDVGTNFMVALVFLMPVLLWNYLTRKVDSWLRSRHSAPSPASVAVLSK